MISNDRINHMLGVAKLMKEYCIKNGYSENYCQEMFTLGLLHDIGYEFAEHKDHNLVGGELLKSQSYKYYKEIMFHGTKSHYSSNELDILNYADMHIDSKGNYVSFDERLNDIKARRGKSSPAYINATNIIKDLISKGFN